MNVAHFLETSARREPGRTALVFGDRRFLGKPEDTARDLRGGWLHSGDIGHRDEDGYFHVVDRVKDRINVAGFKARS